MPRWTDHYDHPVPWATTFAPCAVPDLVLVAAARQPDAPCLDFLGRGFSYGEVADAVRRFAGGLAGLGVGKGTRVGLFLPNCPHYVFAYYGALLAGATVVNCSPLYTADELVAQVEDSGTELMVTLDVAQLYRTIAQVVDRTRLRTLVVGNLGEAMPALKRIAYRLFQRDARARWQADCRHVGFASLVDAAPLADLPAIDPVVDIALLQYTGGTTGVPKGAILTHANLSVNACQVQALDPEPDAPERVLGALPFFHVFANTCVLNRTMLRGGEIVLLPRFTAKAALAAIAAHRLTAVPGVPTMFAALLDAPQLGATDLSSLRVCISGGAPLPAALKTRFEAATGAKLIEGYGLTESAGVVAANPYLGPGRPGSIGQPMPQTAVRLVDKDAPGRDVAAGEPGEIVVAGPQIMRGYLHDVAGSGAAFVTAADGGVWLRTGDIGTIDADGYIFIVDRLKDMIVVGGFKVFPSRVEDVLYRHPAVREAVVIGIPDPRLGERPKAFVTLAAGATATPAELLAFVNVAVGKHEHLSGVEIRETLPKTMIGKLSRKELVAEARALADTAANSGES